MQRRAVAVHRPRGGRGQWEFACTISVWTYASNRFAERITMPHMIAALLAAVTVTVTNATNVVNGSTASLFSLMAAPGADGISLAEALAAARNTPGAKAIVFASTLRGAHIPIGSINPQEFKPLTLGSDLIVDGDIDGDGKPDIVLDGGGHDYGTNLDSRGSNVVLNGLELRDFAGTAIGFACQDADCEPRTISNVRIANNVIDSRRGSGIEIGPWGLLGFSNAPALAGISFVDITIEGNTINSTNAAIGVRPSTSGAPRDSAVNITVRGNRIMSEIGLDVGAADEAHPPYYSDDSLIDNLVIDGNVLDRCSTAIRVYAANLGNQRATIRHLRITNNRVTNTFGYGSITVAASVQPTMERATSHNTVEDVLVAGNEVDGGGLGLLISASDLPTPYDARNDDDNAMRGVVVRDNVFRGYGAAGMLVWGGVSNGAAGSSSRDALEGIAITGNTFEGGPIGLEITAGDCRAGTAANNSVRGVTIGGNVFRNNGVALSLIGGRGPCATGNTLAVASMSANRVEQNGTALQVIENADGANGNRVDLPRRHAAGH
jgi:hypothetical protein